MPLSPEEQRKLDAIEQALRDDDPTLGSSVRFVGLRRRRGIVGGVAVLFGWGVLLAGVVATQALLGVRVGVAFSPAGFLIGSVGMLAVAGCCSGCAAHRSHLMLIGHPNGQDAEHCTVVRDARLLPQLPAASSSGSGRTPNADGPEGKAIPVAARGRS